MARLAHKAQPTNPTILRLNSYSKSQGQLQPQLYSIGMQCNNNNNNNNNIDNIDNSNNFNNNVSISNEVSDLIKRKYQRQNKDLAKANSMQAVRISNLETKIAELLDENIALRSQTIKQQRYCNNKFSYAAKSMYDEIQTKLNQMNQILGKFVIDSQKDINQLSFQNNIYNVMQNPNENNSIPSLKFNLIPNLLTGLQNNIPRVNEYLDNNIDFNNNTNNNDINIKNNIDNLNNNDINIKNNIDNLNNNCININNGKNSTNNSCININNLNNNTQDNQQIDYQNYDIKAEEDINILEEQNEVKEYANNVELENKGLPFIDEDDVLDTSSSFISTNIHAESFHDLPSNDEYNTLIKTSPSKLESFSTKQKKRRESGPLYVDFNIFSDSSPNENIPKEFESIEKVSLEISKDNLIPNEEREREKKSQTQTQTQTQETFILSERTIPKNFNKFKTKTKPKDNDVMPETVLPGARSTGRRKKPINYALPSLRTKMRRESVSLVDAVTTHTSINEENKKISDDSVENKKSISELLTDSETGSETKTELNTIPLKLKEDLDNKENLTEFPRKKVKKMSSEIKVKNKKKSNEGFDKNLDESLNNKVQTRVTDDSLIVKIAKEDINDFKKNMLSSKCSNKSTINKLKEKSVKEKKSENYKSGSYKNLNDNKENNEVHDEPNYVINAFNGRPIRNARSLYGSRRNTIASVEESKSNSTVVHASTTKRISKRRHSQLM